MDSYLLPAIVLGILAVLLLVKVSRLALPRMLGLSETWGGSRGESLAAAAKALDGGESFDSGFGSLRRAEGVRGGRRVALRRQRVDCEHRQGRSSSFQDFYDYHYEARVELSEPVGDLRIEPTELGERAWQRLRGQEPQLLAWQGAATALRREPAAAEALLLELGFASIETRRSWLVVKQVVCEDDQPPPWSTVVDQLVALAEQLDPTERSRVRLSAPEASKALPRKADAQDEPRQ